MATGGKQILELPSGYHFSPTDDEGIHYLKQKILERELPADIVPTIDDLYTTHPENIPYDEFRYGPKDNWWFFTSRPDNGDSVVEGIGYWRTLSIFQINHEGKSIGSKKTRRFFYENQENDLRINNLVIRQHIIYEFITEEATFEPEDFSDNVKEQMEHFVLCKVSIIETVEGVDSNLRNNSMNDQGMNNEASD